MQSRRTEAVHFFNSADNELFGLDTVGENCDKENMSCLARSPDPDLIFGRRNVSVKIRDFFLPCCQYSMMPYIIVIKRIHSNNLRAVDC